MQAVINEMRQIYGLSDRVCSSFLAVNRAHYLPLQHEQFANVNVSVDYLGRISWSVTVVNTVEPVLTDGCRVLVASAFPGYEAAVLSHLVGNNGFVVAHVRSALEANHLREVYVLEVPNYVENERLRVAIGDESNPNQAFAPFNAIIDRKRWSDERIATDYYELLAPSGIAVYYSVVQDRWVAIQRLPDGGIFFLNNIIPSDRSDPHIPLQKTENFDVLYP